MSNVIHVQFDGCVITQTEAVFQWDYGQVLVFDDLDLPLAYETHWSNERYGGTTVTVIGTEDGVEVPDALLQTGKPVYCFIYLHTGEEDGETEYVCTIPVAKRPKPSNATPTPVQQDVITETIAALQTAVGQADEDVALAAGYAQEAENARDTILNMSATASTLPAGSSATASFDHGTGTLSLGIPKGDKGDPGDPGTPGAPGATPNISVAATALPSSDDPTATRSGTDLNPLITFGIPAGKDGTDGDDGFSPVVTVSAITGGHEVSIQDATQTQSFDVMDGEVQSDEVYPQLTAGNAQELDSDLYTVDQTPYLLRASGGNGATRERDKIVGGSVVENQLVNTSDTSITVTSGHKYASNINGTWAVASSNGSAISVTGGTDMVHDLTQMFGTAVADYLYALGSSTAIAKLRAMGYIDDVYHAYDAGTMKHVSGVSAHVMRGFNQWDEQWEVGGINTSTGANANFNDRIRGKNYIPILANATYYCKVVSSYISVVFYDADKHYISGAQSSDRYRTAPSNAHYMRFSVGSDYGTTYKNDICINLSSDRNGEHEPYQANTYALDSTLTLRGVPKIVNGEIVYDGDEYGSDGVVTRKYAVITLDGSQTPMVTNWRPQTNSVGCLFAKALTNAKHPSANADKPNLIANGMIALSYNEGYGTDVVGVGIATPSNDYDLFVRFSDTSLTTGTAIADYFSQHPLTIIYEVKEPTTESADPYLNPQIVDPYGTEEYVTSGSVPVGHYTEYPVSQKGKLDSMPNSLFYTETALKATRAYTTNQLISIKGQLYKVLTSIASGATLTPNTNITAVSLGDLITALLNG